MRGQETHPTWSWGPRAPVPAPQTPAAGCQVGVTVSDSEMPTANEKPFREQVLLLWAHVVIRASGPMIIYEARLKKRADGNNWKMRCAWGGGLNFARPGKSGGRAITASHTRGSPQTSCSEREQRRSPTPMVPVSAGLGSECPGLSSGTNPGAAVNVRGRESTTTVS